MMLNSPPVVEITLEDFELYALDRLQVGELTIMDSLQPPDMYAADKSVVVQSKMSFFR